MFEAFIRPFLSATLIGGAALTVACGGGTESAEELATRSDPLQATSVSQELPDIALSSCLRACEEMGVQVTSEAERRPFVLPQKLGPRGMPKLEPNASIINEEWANRLSNSDRNCGSASPSVGTGEVDGHYDLGHRGIGSARRLRGKVAVLLIQLFSTREPEVPTVGEVQELPLVAEAGRRFLQREARRRSVSLELDNFLWQVTTDWDHSETPIIQPNGYREDGRPNCRTARTFTVPAPKTFRETGRLIIDRARGDAHATRGSAAGTRASVSAEPVRLHCDRAFLRTAVCCSHLVASPRAHDSGPGVGRVHHVRVHRGRQSDLAYARSAAIGPVQSAASPNVGVGAPIASARLSSRSL